ncbi:MAG: hypothetical protein E7665_03990 [Ruminococcaceae bacterium]|nr:hypothetical protein [Oscillospiraceae bacterium]
MNKVDISKAILLLLSLSCVLTYFASCSSNMTDKDEIIKLFRNKERVFLDAANNNDFSKVSKIYGVQNVDTWEDYIDIQCGGAGFGSSTHYYGIFYSENDDLCAVRLGAPGDQLKEHENGFLYTEENGDNRYYVEPLGNHFFYYEAHF